MKHGSISIRDCWFHISLRMTMFRFMIGWTLNWFDIFFFAMRAENEAWSETEEVSWRWLILCSRERFFPLQWHSLSFKSLSKHWLPDRHLISNPPWILQCFQMSQFCLSVVLRLLGKFIIKPFFCTHVCFSVAVKCQFFSFSAPKNILSFICMLNQDRISFEFRAVMERSRKRNKNLSVSHFIKFSYLLYKLS